jgi:uncharacterized protein YbjT (DUF2867 family)
VNAAAGGKRALLAGATGLVGGFCLRRLLADPRYASVTVWSRSPLPVAHAKLSIELVDFSSFPSDGDHVDEIFCCLGTTIRKAGSQEAFRKVDHDYALSLAKFGKVTGAHAFIMVSALGADPRSSVFYNRVKGEAETDIGALGLPRAVFLRPSILLGPRQENRLGERLGILAGRLIAPLLLGRLAKYRPIHADTVAAAMMRVANDETISGAIESDGIERLARSD